MNVTDVLRNETLPPLGVRLEDDPQFRGAYKIVDPKEVWILKFNFENF